MKKLYFLIAFVVIVLIVVGGFFIYKNYFSKETQTSTTNTKPVKLDPQKEATHLSKVAGEKNAYWMRGFDVVWNVIEPEKGKYNWEENDRMLTEFKDGQAQGAYHLSIIWPYANWDQITCHSGKKYVATGHLKRGGEDLYMGAPCDMEAYSQFIREVVERYDGDGRDDMPDLKIPVKYWEIINEPEMQGGGFGGAGEDLKFFVGTPQEYVEILETSYKAIKKADSSAKVLYAGMAGMQKNFQDFWDPVFAGGGGGYFDIANIHSISTDEQREDLYVIKFKKYLEKYGIENKPIWVTEVQFGQLMDKPKDLTAFEKLMVRATVFSLAQGAEKLFFIENWTMWDNKEMFKPPEEDDESKKETKGKPPKLDLSNNSTHKVYLNLVDKINSFDKIETIKEKFTEGQDDREGATSQVAQYKFVNGDKAVYVLWGNAELPTEITGKLKVTDIYGVSREVETSALQLSDSPLFVELKK